MKQSLLAIALVIAVFLGGMGVGRSVERTHAVEREAQLAQLAVKQTAAAREEGERKARVAEDIADAASKREAALLDRAAHAERTVVGLRGAIADLNARPTPEEPAAAAAAGEARAARELLGACADRYRGLAQDADGLRDQVTGLQDFARDVLKAGQ